jgi:hypothetical protein
MPGEVITLGQLHGPAAASIITGVYAIHAGSGNKEVRWIELT